MSVEGSRMQNWMKLMLAPLALGYPLALGRPEPALTYTSYPKVVPSLHVASYLPPMLPP